jgi:hypothetical protein
MDLREIFGEVVGVLLCFYDVIIPPASHGGKSKVTIV